MANVFKVITRDVMSASADTDETLYTVQSSKSIVILGMMLANVHTSQVTATVKLVSTTTQTSQTQNTTTHLIKDVPIPVGSTFELLQGNKIIANADDVIIGNTSASLMGLSIVTSTSGYATLQFSDGGGNKNQGQVAYDHSTNAMQFTTNESLAMTLDSSGRLGIGTTSPAETFHVKGAVSAFERTDVNSGTHERVCGFRDGGGTERGNISVSNASVQFNTTSDYRLKENQTSITDGITRLKTLKPYQFNFKQNPDVKVDGFFAHEVTAVPEAVSGTKDQVVVQADVDKGLYPESKLGDPIHQGIDQSKLVPLLTAALQEAITKIETLETKVAALEAK